MRNIDLGISILKREHHDTLKKLIEKATSFNSVNFSKENAIKAYYDFALKTNKDLTAIDWVKETSLRRDLVAFMLLTFAPERIRGYSEKVFTWGFAKDLSLIIHVSRRLVTKDIQLVSDEFRIYKDFKNRCLEIFNKSI